ncbi:hypothetical protein CRM22_005952 [Opisthorchis felineus]|uniref:Uncharacterized protein n=1 Tax=Opisthorchis felineus TaxID=147828 RepID=A0A4S2LQ20_OPIFE|nr:hypothetical protein CRM22_005952 [Opisthorchis felineus]
MRCCLRELSKSMSLYFEPEDKLSCPPRYHNKRYVYGSQDEARRLRMALYPNCDAVVLCASLDNPVSLENLSKKWLEELRTARMTRHPLLLALTKSDLRVDSSADLIKPEAISQNARKLQVTDLFECSAKTGENVKQTFRRAAELVVRTDGEKNGKCCAIS